MISKIDNNSTNCNFYSYFSPKTRKIAPRTYRYMEFQNREPIMRLGENKVGFLKRMWDTLKDIIQATFPNP